MASYRDAEEAFRTQCYEKAIELYFEILRDHPDDFGAWCNLGISFGRIKRPGDALKCFEKAIELRPGSSEAWYNLGLSHGALGNRDEEFRCYNRALELAPSSQLVTLKKIEVLRLMGREKEANELFRQFTRRRRDELARAAR